MLPILVVHLFCVQDSMFILSYSNPPKILSLIPAHFLTFYVDFVSIGVGNLTVRQILGEQIGLPPLFSYGKPVNLVVICDIKSVKQIK